MKTNKIIQNKEINQKDIDFIQQLIKQNPNWHRTRLSIELSKLWDWKNNTGQLKDMACRRLLKKLDAQGYIVLPPLLRKPSKKKKKISKKSFKFIPHSQKEIKCLLKDILPIKIKEILPVGTSHKLFQHLLSKYHYLGYIRSIGQNVKYIVYDKYGRELACLLFDTAAWKTKPRDNFIGWNKDIQANNLYLIANNSRFLILPWIQVPHLASHLMGKIIKRINGDWQKKYNCPLYLLETFIEKHRFKGTCYKAANWQYIGDTQGRTRNDRFSKIKAPIKEIYIYPLNRNYKKLLCQMQ